MSCGVPLLSVSTPRVTVCTCTFRRPRMLRRLLDTLLLQQTGGRFEYSVVVCDNDPARSAEVVVAEFKEVTALLVAYVSEPRTNIALARNAALRAANGEFIAFIDDDEFPEPDWLHRMLQACVDHDAAGILGPVRPHFENPPPAWIVRGGFCDRPEYPTGRVVHWEESRTGNLLFRRSILEDEAPAFREEFGTGGEDKDFFMRMAQRGHVFRWCNEGIAWETVPPERWTRRYMLHRALLRGNNILKLPGQKLGLLVRSAVALPVYLVMLPFTLLGGQHVFMKYCIRFCDHAGRLLGAVGLNPVKERM